MEGDESSEKVYFGDDEDSSESDQERTEGKAVLRLGVFIDDPGRLLRHHSCIS